MASFSTLYSGDVDAAERAALEYFTPAASAARAALRSTLDDTRINVDCGHRVHPKPTLDQLDRSR